MLAADTKSSGLVVGVPSVVVIEVRVVMGLDGVGEVTVAFIADVVENPLVTSVLVVLVPVRLGPREVAEALVPVGLPVLPPATIWKGVEYWKTEESEAWWILSP